MFDIPVNDNEDPRTQMLRSRRLAIGVSSFVLFLWLIHLFIVLSNWEPSALGIRPGALAGLTGIATAPLIHGSWGHLISNTPPLMILGFFVLYNTPRAGRIALPIIWLGSGLGVWLFARESVHIGASGLTYGMLFYLFLIGLIRRDRQSIALTLVVFFLYGSMIWGVFPLSPGVSFEYHLFGAIAGSLCAIVFRKLDPLPERKRYDWEEEADDLETDHIDDYR